MVNDLLLALQIPQYIGYVSGPYTSNSIDVVNINIAAAESTGREVAAKGYTPIIPHAIFHHYNEDTRFTYERLLASCVHLMHKSDFVVLCGEWWNSRGACYEIDWAISRGLPIFTSIDDLPQFTVTGYLEARQKVLFQNPPLLMDTMRKHGLQ